MLIRRTAFAVWALVMAQTGFAQIIECTGKDGKKEFAQTCPPGTVKQREVVNGAAAKAVENSPAAGSKKSTNDLELEFQQRRIAREQEADKAEQQLQNQKAKCANLMRRIDGYETASRVYKNDPVTGKKIYMEDAQREANLAQMRNEAQNCK